MTAIKEQSANDEQANTTGRNKSNSTVRDDIGKPNITSWIEAACAVALVIITWTYTHYAAQQVVETRRAITQASELFTRDQRPIVWPDNWKAMSEIPGLPKVALMANVGQIVFWNYAFSNFGKSPALKVVGKVLVFVGPTALKQADAFFAGLPSRLNPQPSSVIMPADKGNNFSTAQSQNIVTPEEFLFGRIQDFGYVLAGRFEYEDSTRLQYRSDFCYGTFATGAVTHCPTHNDIPEGQRPK